MPSAAPPTPTTLRALPAVEKLLLALGPLDIPRPVAAAIARRELNALRAELKTGNGAPPDFPSTLTRVIRAINRLRAGKIQPVINATGIPLHTNLGRAPLPTAAVDALAAAAAGYTSLEYDLTTGERGGRAAYLEHNLALATGAEAATVVNNCAAALVLMLKNYTRGAKQTVVISRGELVQIGGGFRVPEIMESSGARLREVGTTNRTTLDDYAAAIDRETALILTVHRGNFYQEGFTGSPVIAELAALARRRRVPLAEDLGSGALSNACPPARERAPADAIRDGVDAVCFSGDKLLGGPQAGIIVGRARRIAAFKREPFFRALRCDKLALSALEATLDLHLAGRQGEIPALAMLRLEPETLRARAEQMIRALAELPLAASMSKAVARVGGGTLPRVELASVAVDLLPPDGTTLETLAARLRTASPPVIGYVSGRRYRLDLRTVFPAQDALIIQALRAVLANP